MDGWRLAAEINGDNSINGSKLVLMVPQGRMEGDAKMTLLKWFDGYVGKPVTVRGLYNTVMSAFEEPIPEAESVENTENKAVEIPDGMLVPPDLVPAASTAGAVLIVEDHQVNRKLFALIMEKLRLKAVLAEDGVDALEKAGGNVDIVFMDLQMPRMNGFEAAAELRRRGFDRPIIAVTAGVMDGEQNRCMESGFDDMLLKPFKRPDIEAMLEKWKGKPGQNRLVPEGRAQADRVQAGGEQRSGVAANVEEIFNPNDLVDTFLEDGETARSLLKKFLEHSEAQIGLLKSLEEAGTWEEARRIAHTVKGSSLTLSGKELGAAAARLETAYRNAATAEIESAYEPFIAAFGRFKAAAEAYLGPNQI
jgi:CheY-like chemotaxis protein/HPt (histidine-containing phosphotransfer) domain-containing protein